MNLNSMKLIATRSVGRSALMLQKYSPEILITAGMFGLVAGTVLVYKASLKVDTILDSAKENVDKIKQATELGEDVYSRKDRKRDLMVTYSQTGFELVKTFGPGVTLGIASVVCILSSQNILKKRNVVLAAAYTTLEKGFSSYRKRVVEEYGSDKDAEFRYGIKKEKITTEVIDATTGKVTKQKETVVTMTDDPALTSPYAKFFDSSCEAWSKNPEFNLMFLKGKQNWFNHRLATKGHVFLNEVYDELDILRTEAGALCGWLYNGEGDGHIDFHLYDIDRPATRKFVNGIEPVILLDFNVDGPIHHLI
jgi:hypothetical protein